MIIRKSSEIYLDSNATTPVLPSAVAAAHEAMEEAYGNPSSTHVSGLKARHILESARDLVREVLGANDGQIVFTSGATEAIQMAVLSTLCAIRQQRLNQPVTRPRLLLYGATEHKAVPQALSHWNRLLCIEDQVVPIPVDRQGQLDLDFIRQHAPDADMICTMAVNNETGVIANLAAIESAIREVNPEVRWLVDCVQAVGKTNMQLSQTSIDYAAVSGHKIYAPKGIGLLYVRHDAPLVPLLAGGGQEHGARGGTENLPGVAAIAAVLKDLAKSPTHTFAGEAQLHGFQRQLIDALSSAFPTMVLNTPLDHAVPTTINFAVKGFPNKELLDLFDAAGIRVSSGSACGSAVQGSYVLEAMGVEPWQSDGAIRMSFGPLTKQQEISAACERIRAAGQALCESCLAPFQDDQTAPEEQVDGLIQLKNGSMCTWLLLDSESRNCLVIDPFEELAERTEAIIRCQRSHVLAVLDSHAHVDHDSCRQMLLKDLGSLVRPSANTPDELGWPTQVDGSVTLGDGSQAPYLHFSKDWIVAQVNLPGHTQIGRTFLVGSMNAAGELLPEDVAFAFTGDMILMGGVGRTDFPCSSIECMYESLQRLPKLIGPESVICPTHDYNNEFATTLCRERQVNEFLRQVTCPDRPLSLDEFKQRKPSIDAGIADETNQELVCGLIQPISDAELAAVDIPRGELKQYFQDHRNSWIIDVREPHEFCFALDWSELGFDSPPQNIPLTRIAGFLPDLIRANRQAPRDVIFLCRSGRRSGVAAAVARRMGVTSARHIAGGIALNVATKCVADEWSDPGYMI